MTHSTLKKNALSLLAIVTPCLLWGQQVAEKAAAADSGFKLELNPVLLVIMVVLLLPLYLTGQTFLLTAKRQLESGGKEAGAVKKGIGVLLLLVFFSQIASAQTADTAAPASSSFDIFTWLLLMVIALEIFLIALFARLTANFFKSAPVAATAEPEPATSGQSTFWRLWDRINKFKPLEEEASLDTGHDYDGIKELDNVTPPWFLAAFGFTILFAIVYLWRYHVAESAPLQAEEFEIAMAQADLEDAARLSSQANKVDENTVVMLGAADIEQGKKIFIEKCSPCHNQSGGSMPGGVGPNLTDDYWINGGSLKAIFSTIKYGRTDKGMISWKDQLSPMQMAQAASFIKSIRGTNPPNAKEPQGELYVEETEETVQDTTQVNK